MEKTVLKLGSWEIFQNSNGKIEFQSTLNPEDSVIVDFNFWLDPIDTDPTDLNTTYPNAKDGSLVFSTQDNSIYRYESSTDSWASVIAGNTDSSLPWKPAVNDVSDLTSTYPTPTIGWVVPVISLNSLYIYDGSDWVNISNQSLSPSILSSSGNTRIEAKPESVYIYKDLYTIDNVSVHIGVSSSLTLTHSAIGSYITSNKGDMNIFNEENLKDINITVTDGVGSDTKTIITNATSTRILHSNIEKIRVDTRGTTFDRFIQIKDNTINNILTEDNTGSIIINNVGFDDTTSYFRNFIVKDGKGYTILNIDGTTKTTSFGGDVSINGYISINTDPTEDTHLANKRYVDIIAASGNTHQFTTNNTIFSLGSENTVTSGEYSSILSGSYNTINGNFSTITSGNYNTLSGNFSVISGGSNNTVASTNGAILAGINNRVNGVKSTIINGNNNNIGGISSVIVTGQTNKILGDHSSILNGKNSIINTFNSVILGGDDNLIDTNHSNTLIGVGNGLKSTGIDQTIFGNWNDTSTDSIFMIGGGTTDLTRKNVLEVHKSGRTKINSSIILNEHNDTDTPEAGEIQYSLTKNKITYFNGTVWKPIGSGESVIHKEDGIFDGVTNIIQLTNGITRVLSLFIDGAQQKEVGANASYTMDKTTNTIIIDDTALDLVGKEWYIVYFKYTEALVDSEYAVLTNSNTFLNKNIFQKETQFNDDISSIIFEERFNGVGWKIDTTNNYSTLSVDELLVRNKIISSENEQRNFMGANDSIVYSNSITSIKITKL